MMRQQVPGLVDVEDKALRTVSFVHALCVIRRGYRVEYPPFHQHHASRIGKSFDAFCSAFQREKALRNARSTHSVGGLRREAALGKLIVLHAVLAHGAHQRVKVPDGKKVDAEFSGEADIRQCVRAGRQRHQRIKAAAVSGKAGPCAAAYIAQAVFFIRCNGVQDGRDAAGVFQMGKHLTLSRPLLGKRFGPCGPGLNFFHGGSPPLH